MQAGAHACALAKETPFRASLLMFGVGTGKASLILSSDITLDKSSTMINTMLGLHCASYASAARRRTANRMVPEKLHLQGQRTRGSDVLVGFESCAYIRHLTSLRGTQDSFAARSVVAPESRPFRSSARNQCWMSRKYGLCNAKVQNSTAAQLTKRYHGCQDHSTQAGERCSTQV